MVRRLGEHDRRERVRLCNIGIGWLEVLREYSGVAVCPETKQPGGEGDADDEIYGERAVLQRPKLLAGQRLEGDHTCGYCELEPWRVAAQIESVPPTKVTQRATGRR